MKKTFLITALQNGAKRIPLGLGFALTVTCLQLNTTAQEVDLGTANNFAVLAGSAVTSSGNTVINGGNVGVSPGTAVTGFYPPGVVNGPYTVQSATAAAAQAQSDLTTAFNAAAGFAPTSGNDYTSFNGGNLGGLTLTPGVYFFSTTAAIKSGTLTLNDLGNPDAVFIFQIGSTLTTASDTSVVTINSGAPQGSVPGVSVFWQVGSAATLGTGTSFEGNIMAYSAITDDGGSMVDGRLLAETAGAVTLNDTTVNVPLPEYGAGSGGSGGGSGGGGVGDGTVPDTVSTLLLLGSGLTALFAFGRRVSLVLRQAAAQG